MPPKPTNWWLYTKMLLGGAFISIGGPLLVYSISPTEEQLFQKYNPDLQRRSLESRAARQQDFDDFVCRLKQYAKSDRPIWEVAAEAENAEHAARIKDQERLVEEVQRRRQAIREETEGKV